MCREGRRILGGLRNLLGLCDEVVWEGRGGGTGDIQNREKCAV